MKSPTLKILILSFVLFSCNNRSDEFKVTGYAPIYKDKVSSQTVKLQNYPSAITSAGKIVSQGNTIYVVENGEGIHILNYNPTSSPEHIGFIESQGCSDLAIKGGRLYTNNMFDLVVLDISDLSAVKLVSRSENVFRNNLDEHPPYRGYYFECPRDNDSVIVGWKLQVIENPSCYYE